MKFPFFIVKRIALNQNQSFSRFIIRIAIVAVALSMTVMLLSTSLISGFQQTISQKVFGFWAHILITPYANPDKLDENPISKNNKLYLNPSNFADIKHIQVTALKAGIMQTKNAFEGILLKGVGKDFNTQNFSDYIKTGALFPITENKQNKGLLISQIIANKLEAKVGDKIVVSFFDSNTRIRKRAFKVSGIYDSGMEDFDKQYALIDIAVIQDLNGWQQDQVGAFEVFLNPKSLFSSRLTAYAKRLASVFMKKEAAQNMRMDGLDIAGKQLHNKIDDHLYAQTIKEFEPEIFNWLALQDTNEIVILFVMLLVSAVNMITSLLILIIERTSMIGILKSLGARDHSVRKIFILNGVFIIGFGLVIGNILGISLCALQDAFHFIKLPKESYYVEYAPIKIELGWIVFLNIFTLIISALFLVLPAMLVNRIEPIKAIKFS